MWEYCNTVTHGCDLNSQNYLLVLLTGLLEMILTRGISTHDLIMRAHVCVAW